MKEGLKTSQGRRDYQKMLRRRETLFKKATEYDVQCDADIQLVVRMRKTGQIVILTTNSKGWPLSAEQLVSLLLPALPIPLTIYSLPRIGV